MDKNVQRDHSHFNLYLITCAANLATLSAGCTMTWTSPTLPKLLVPNDRITITKEQGAWIGSLLPLGACFGPPLITLVVDKIGKKLSLLLCTLMIISHWIIIAIIDALQTMYMARFIAGMAVGTVFNLIPVYIAEISPDEIRGLTGSLFTLFLFTGCNIPYIVGPFTSISTLILVVVSIPMLTVLLFTWIPESPYYLLSKGRKHQAYKALQKLRSYPDDSVVQNEMDELQEILNKSHREKSHTESAASQLFQLSNLKALYYGCGLIFFQQMAGFNAVLFYSEAIFKKSSSSSSSSIATIICGLVMMGAAVAVPFMGKLFRIKNVLYFSASGCFLSLVTRSEIFFRSSTEVKLEESLKLIPIFQIILGVYFNALEQGEVGESLSWVPIICVVGYIISHSLGFGSYAWVIVAEIFHPVVKTIASAFTVAFCWFLCFLITKFFATFVDLLDSSGTFWLFAAFCLLSLIFLVFQLPDTQGKSFQEIQDLIAGKNKGVVDDEKIKTTAYI